MQFLGIWHTHFLGCSKRDPKKSGIIAHAPSKVFSCKVRSWKGGRQSLEVVKKVDCETYGDIIDLKSIHMYNNVMYIYIYTYIHNQHVFDDSLSFWVSWFLSTISSNCRATFRVDIHATSAAIASFNRTKACMSSDLWLRSYDILWLDENMYIYYIVCEKACGYVCMYIYIYIYISFCFGLRLNFQDCIFLLCELTAECPGPASSRKVSKADRTGLSNLSTTLNPVNPMMTSWCLWPLYRSLATALDPPRRSDTGWRLGPLRSGGTASRNVLTYRARHRIVQDIQRIDVFFPPKMHRIDQNRV